MKLSIIVPVYRVEAYLRRCVDSILAQTFRDFELILVDDGSPDGCPAICDEYAKIDSRVKAIHMANGGLSAARNAGLDVAQGEYIGFVDSDDWIHPQMYEILCGILEKKGTDIVQCNIQQFSDEFPKVKKMDYSVIEASVRLYERSDYIRHFFPEFRWIIGPTVCNKIYRRAFFLKTSFPENRLFEDSNVQLEILSLANKVAVINECMYFYFQRPGSIMHSKYEIRKANDMNEICEKQLLFFERANEKEQIQYALDNYLERFLRDKFAVWIKHPELKAEFALIERRFGRLIVELLRNPKLCRMKKFTLCVSYISPKLAYWLCLKFFPECIHDFMR